MDKIELPKNSSDGVAELTENSRKPPLWGSARFTYTICAFLAMVSHLCLRNTLNFITLCMVKPQQTNYTNEYNITGENSTCGPIESDIGTSIEGTGDLLWTRSQEFELLGSFYYGYLITLPFAGRLADKFGGKLLFVHSLTVQAIVFMLIPLFARISYAGAVAIRLIQGLIGGCGNPALYQLFSTWAHPSERTAFLSIAYAGFSAGSVLVFPVSSFLCKFGWEWAFYAIGSISLLFGVCCNWLVYNTLEDHPRLSKEEYDYLKPHQVSKSSTAVPWKLILTSVPVYAFIITHFFHSYGDFAFSMIIPRFFREAMHLPLGMVGLLSSAPFIGAFISKTITITCCNMIEKRPNLNLTRFRRISYLVCSSVTIMLIFGMIISSCQKRVTVVLFAICIGICSDLAFSGVYWPSLLNLAPSYTGLISGLANCLATVNGFLGPLGISSIVRHGTKDEWNLVLSSLMTSYLLAAITFSLFGSSNLAPWGQVSNVENTSNNNNKNNAETE